jgi:hypothetical protein
MLQRPWVEHDPEDDELSFSGNEACIQVIVEADSGNRRQGE